MATSITFGVTSSGFFPKLHLITGLLEDHLGLYAIRPGMVVKTFQRVYLLTSIGF